MMGVSLLVAQTYGEIFNKGSREAFAAMLEDTRKKKPKDDKVRRPLCQQHVPFF